MICKLFCLLVLVSCGRSTHPPLRIEGVAFAIPYSIQVDASPSSTKEIQETIKTVFDRIDRVYNNWNPHSEVSQLALLPAHQKIELSSELASFLLQISSWVCLTEGRFDPTVEPLQKLWKHYLNKGSTPPPHAIDILLPAIGWENIHLEGNLFWKEHDQTALDLGGAAKGLAVDLILTTLQEDGYTNIFVEWGGEIRTLGEHPQKRPWTIAIVGAETRFLSDRAIATSGSYIQQWKIDDTLYTHIIDPRTKRPLSQIPIQSASVVAPTCAEADALATAMMLFPSLEEGRQWAQAHSLDITIW